MSSVGKNDANNQVAFITLIKKERETIEHALAQLPRGDDAVSLVESKSMNSVNGLETSTFTICVRTRPMLHGEQMAFESNSDASAGMYECLARAPNEPVAAPLSAASKTQTKPLAASGGGPARSSTAEVKAETSGETLVVFKPKLAITGKPKLEKENFLFDKVFGRDASNDDVYQVCKPLVQRSILGQVGTIFAFGQTGSGKTFTMNAVLDAVVDEIFQSSALQSSSTVGPTGLREGVRVSFSYLELLGSNAKDCLGTRKSSTASVQGHLPATGEIGQNKSMAMSVEIGELLDGSVAIRNLSEHTARNPNDLKSLISIAKSFRATAATERNAESSRSHGIGIFRIFQSIEDGPAPGVLYVIDLAGSERMADSKNHDSERLEETKAINVSLMCLKECIRARTMASSFSSAEKTHVPYRRSKLTLLMKDCFDIASNRLSNTVVLAHVSPLARDNSHSLNTLKYAAPLRVAVTSSSKKMERDRKDPATWSHDEAVSWVLESLRVGSSAETAANSNEAISSGGAAGGGAVAGVQLDSAEIDLVLKSLLAHPSTNGLTLCRLTEFEYLKKIEIAVASFPSGTPVVHCAAAISKLLYNKLWMLICDAKTRRRRPNGTIISAQEEAAEVQRSLDAQIVASELWKSREAALNSAF
jgi:kinesin family protein 2/24